MSREKITQETIRGMKGNQGIAALTVYDYPITRLLDEIGVPLLLVGDSLGMVVLGYPDTTHVTMDHMEHHVAAAARAKPKAFLVADLPFHSYETPEQAVINARRLIDAGAEAVKAEGGRAILSQIKAIINAGIPVCGHLGMLPQSVLDEGGYKIKGRVEQERVQLMIDAKALERAGAFAIILELVLREVAAEITDQINIPTIGIGSGDRCDGQILVSHDLFGLFPWFTPKFVKPKMQGGLQIQSTVSEWIRTVQNLKSE